MIWIFVKLALALTLSAIPFLVKYYIIPKGKTDAKYKSAFALFYESTPRMRRKMRKFAQRLIGAVRKLEISKKYRRLFLTALVLVLVSFQMVNIKASNEAVSMADMNHTCTKLESTTLPFGTKMATCLMWNKVDPVVNLGILTILFIMIFYKSANAIVTKIHQSKMMQVALTGIVLACILNPEGKLFTMGIFIYTILLAAFIYPPFNKRKCERYYAFKEIRKERCRRQMAA